MHSAIRSPKYNQKGTIVLRAVDRDPVLTVGAERTLIRKDGVAVQMRRPRHEQLRQTAALGLFAAGERLRSEDQPRQLFGDYPQLVLRAGFVEPIDHRDQRADMLLGQLKELLGGLSRH